MLSRRTFATAGLVAAGTTILTAGEARALGEPQRFTDPATREPLSRKQLGGRTPFVTLNGGSLPWRMKDGVKEFHLVAEPVQRELAPGSVAHLWGYNGSSPGPTIEAVEGDRVRIFVTNRLPEHTTVHWHGILLPAGMDGVGGLTQPQIQPGETFAYEFTLKKSGTFMYHPHADEMVQMAMGMMGMFIVHPKDPSWRRVDRDFGFLMASFRLKPGTFVPDASEMTDFNIWAWNGRVFPGIDPLVVRKGDRVRIRIGNLTMTNHPIHLHGYDFRVTGTDGGWLPEVAQWPEVTVDVPVGAMRTIEFVADEEGDWAFHCHKSHHTMGPMGHGVANMLGVRQAGATPRVKKLLPDYMYMPMGEKGMAEMQDMAAHMPPPENTLPMMIGEGPFGPLEMGGMFTTVKVRRDLAPGDYTDPGWYEHPEGTVAWKVDANGRRA
ncbi:multicopper oxidase family protein [Benzoatithermus flavus]|uniref:Copper oxidase n=1 Tax=Benzoatithermus flavus TaxID=3108223 RepID=A0ABU8XPJ0_9PROT